MKISVLTPSVSRKAGGMFESVRNLAIETSKAGNIVSIHALQDKYSQQDSKYWLPLKPLLCKINGPVSFGFSPNLHTAIKQSRPDILHQHGLWMYPSLVSYRFSFDNVKIIISPRGMLDKWALNNSRYKKRLAYQLFEKKNLIFSTCIHALCESEYDSIRSLGIKVPICVIPNGVATPEATKLLPPWNVSADHRIVLFLGRIHPKKGIFTLLDGWVECPEELRRDWNLVIAGWGDEKHVKDLTNRIEKQGNNRSIHFIGSQYDSEKIACFSNADAFILPSHSEGLPMAILEAWSYRLPVLMSRQCNLNIGFDSKAAIEIEPKRESIIEGLKELFSLTDTEKDSYGRHGQKLVESIYSWPLVAKQMTEVYEWMLGSGNRPDCIIEN